MLQVCGNTMIPHRSSEYLRVPRGARGVYDVRSIVTVIKKRPTIKLNFSLIY